MSEQSLDELRAALDDANRYLGTHVKEKHLGCLSRALIAVHNLIQKAEAGQIAHNDAIERISVVLFVALGRSPDPARMAVSLHQAHAEAIRTLADKWSDVLGDEEEDR